MPSFAWCIIMSTTSDCTRSEPWSCRIPVIVALVVVTLFLVMPAAAHNPTDIVMSYDPGTEKLSVTITHPVADPATHYVNKVQVRQNGRTISDPDYKSQPDKNTFTYTYDVKGIPGDTFWVLATCSQGGSLEKKYDLPLPATVTTLPATAPPQAPAQAPAPAPTQKSPLGILPVLGAAAFLLMKKE